MKKLITVALAIALAACIVTGIVACDTKSETVRLLLIQSSDGDFSDYNLGDFYYKKSADESGAYPDLGVVSFKVQYEDGSFSSLAADDPELKVVEINKDGVKVESAPVLYDVGKWTYVYEYKGAKANVSFNIMPASNAEYQITGLPSSWEYSAIPSLTETISVSGYADPLVYFGEDSNAFIYYIQADVFEENFTGVTMDENKLYELEVASSLYYPFSDDGSPDPIFINAGEYYFYLKLSASGNYAAQLTNPQKVTVEKETLDIGSLPTLETSYKFYSYNGPGNAKISEILIPPYYSFSVTNKGGIAVQLNTSDWMNPDDEISVGTPDKKYRIALMPDGGLDNYNADNLYIECTVAATAGYVQSDYDTFSFGDAEQLVVNREVQLNEFTQKGLKFFTALGLSNNDALLESYFKMVDVFDENGNKLPVYAENSDTPLFAGDDGASGKVVRTTDGSVYDYRIVLNENAIGDYTFTVSLIDDVNFHWGTFDKNYGVEPITLNYSVTENDPKPYVYISDTDVTSGVFTFDVYLSAGAYDDTLLNTFKITIDESYTNSNGFVVYTSKNLTVDTDGMQVTASYTTDGQVRLSVALPVTLPDTPESYHLCFTVAMETADTYTDISVSTYAGLY